MLNSDDNNNNDDDNNNRHNQRRWINRINYTHPSFHKLHCTKVHQTYSNAEDPIQIAKEYDT